MKVAAAAAGIAICFVLLRLGIAADGDASRFVVAGTVRVDPSGVPDELHVFEGAGYDGQFSWRLAADPTEIGTERHLGIELDSLMRSQRIGYPWLAWAASFGSLGRVAWALIIVNIVAIAALGGVGAVLAIEGGRSPWMGLVLAGVPGAAFVLARDLAELVAVALLAGGFLAIRRQRWWLAAGLWSYAVLTREQLVLAIAAFGTWRIVEVGRRRSRPDRRDLVWTLPALAFCTWQGVILTTQDGFATGSGVSPHLGLPFVGLVRGMGHWVVGLDDSLEQFVSHSLWFGLTALLAALATSALGTAVPREDIWAKWMVIAVAVLAAMLTHRVWDDPADLRTMSDLFVVSWILLLVWGRGAAIGRLAGAQAIGLTVAAAVRIAAV